MSYSIEKVAVLGSGTMGAAIAAHVANAGLPVLLLDIVPHQLTDKEEQKGLTLDHPAVRNRIVSEGFERIRKLKPASFMSREAESLVSLGNLEDDLEQLADCDWIVEAIIEKLDIKRQLMERLETVRRRGALVTTNTSGLPIDAIAEGRGDDFRRSFFGTHFFNPPRYMKLLEIISGSATDAAAVAAFADFASRRLGKGVVRCKDTPNFIGNRLMSIHGSYAMHYTFAHGYRFEEVDAVSGPLLGRPKTATFRLQDLVGIDVAWYVAQNLHDLIPEDFYRDVLHSEKPSAVVGGLLERGWLGNKSGQGFYKKTKGKGGKPEFLVLDPDTFEYEAQRDVDLPAVAAVKKTRDIGQRLEALFSDEWQDDRGARLAWALTSHFLAYAASTAQEIAYDLESVDRAVRWGFAYENGPFELWDKLGVAATAAKLEASGYEVAAWVKEMLAAGCDTFYRVEGGRVTGSYDWRSKSYVDLERDPRHIRVDDLRLAGKELRRNQSASLLDMGDGVLLLEFHAKMNAIDGEIVAMMRAARELLDDDAWTGLVIGNDGANFCVGANLMEVAIAAQQGDFTSIEQGSRALQDALQEFRYGPKPVVAAVHGMALGGGCEIAIGVSRLLAAAESYLGLVEVGVGLVPGGGGLKELVRRRISRAMKVEHTDPLTQAQPILETVAMAKVSTSAAEAADYGYLDVTDRVIMNREHLLYEARQEVLTLAAEGWVAPPRAKLYAAGRDLLAALKIAIWSLEQAGFASAHDAHVAGKIAAILSGGDLSAPQWVDEDYFLGLERHAFVDLVRTEKTQDRIRHMLETGKPLRN